MKVIYLRKTGFSNNSSSYHSLVLLRKQDRQVIPVFHGYEGYEREYFLLASTEAKKKYLTTQMLEYRRKTNRRDLTNHDISEIANVELEFVNEIESEMDEFLVVIDHQSVPNFPVYYHNPNMPHIGFLREYAAYVLRSDVAVRGGSDENGVSRRQRNGRLPFDKASETSPPNVAVYNSKHGTWHVFNQRTGAIVVMSFNSPEELALKGFKPATTKSHRPDLVDMSITDFCPVGCRYCYQGSTKRGLHADFQYICQCLAAMSQAKVFEVAFGGGEPTLHPDFPTIMAYARGIGLTPNFTTRHYGWMDDEAKRLVIMEAVGGFAVSVSNADDIETLIERLEKYSIEYDKRKGGKVSVQVVMGTIDAETFRELLTTAGKYSLPVTLLGYKHTGRAKKTIPISYEWWSQVAKSSNCFDIGIDTVMAEQFPDIMSELPAWMYETSDGKRSCYIHAGKERMYESSYRADDPGVALDFDSIEMLGHDFVVAWNKLGGG